MFAKVLLQAKLKWYSNTTVQKTVLLHYDD